MKMLPVMSCAVLIASWSATATAQSSPEDSDRRAIRAYVNGLNLVKPGSGFASRPKLPAAYRASVWAEGLGNTRMIALAPNGDVYVSRRSEADIIRLADRNGDGRADGPPQVIVNRPGLHGLMIHDGTMYFMSAREVFRAPIRPDGGLGTIETIIDDLPDAGQHLNRTLAVGPDRMLYISVGSTCNACGVAVMRDGSLLFSDDANGVLYRVTYEGAVGTAAPYAPPAGPMRAQADRGLGVSLALARPEAKARGSRRIQVSSPAFAANGAIPREHSEYGVGVSPALSWDPVPGARAYAIVAEDPDATRAPVVHWLAWNIPTAATTLPAGLQERDRLTGGVLEGAMQGATSRGTVGWYGPRPPRGDRPHRYHLQVLALDRMLDLPLGATRDLLLAAARGHVLATGELVGTYAEPADATP